MGILGSFSSMKRFMSRSPLSFSQALRHLVILELKQVRRNRPADRQPAIVADIGPTVMHVDRHNPGLEHSIPRRFRGRSGKLGPGKAIMRHAGRDDPGVLMNQSLGLRQFDNLDVGRRAFAEHGGGEGGQDVVGFHLQVSSLDNLARIAAALEVEAADLLR